MAMALWNGGGGATGSTRWQRAEPGSRCEKGSEIMCERTAGGIIHEEKSTSTRFTSGDPGKKAPLACTVCAHGDAQ